MKTKKKQHCQLDDTVTHVWIGTFCLGINFKKYNRLWKKLRI